MSWNDIKRDFCHVNLLLKGIATEVRIKEKIESLNLLF